MLKFLRAFFSVLFMVSITMIVFCSAVPAAETPLVTGNGHGFAVYSFVDGKISRFYAHPYKFEKPDPRDLLAEGVETPSLVKTLRFKDPGSASTAPSGKKAHYLQESQIIIVENGGERDAYFMPFTLEQNLLVAAGNSKKAKVLELEFEHKLKVFRRSKRGSTEYLRFEFEGLNSSLLALPLLPATENNQIDFVDGRLLKGANAWAFICVETSALSNEQIIDKFLAWRDGKSASEICSRELSELEKWRVKAGKIFKNESERRLWRQSEVVLRMAQIREANMNGRYGHGLILASLPDGAWFVPWVRDMAYAVHAFTQMGHKQEAKWALEAFLNARPQGKLSELVNMFPYQISLVRYFGNGEEEPFFTMEGAVNVEYDDWGLFLWILSDYVLKFSEREFLDQATYRGSVYENAREFVVKPLLGNLEKYKGGLILQADTSIWEERQKDKKHFAFSNIAAIKGLSGFARLAELKGDKDLLLELDRKLALLKSGFREAFVKDGRIVGTLEAGVKNEHDGAVLSAFTLDLMNDREIIDRTLAAMDKLKMPSGGYRRVTSIVSDPEIFEYWYERQEFLFIDFLLAEVYLKLGMKEKAEGVLAPIVARSLKDNGFIPEMYVSEKNYRFRGEIGDPTGAVPMVGYGAGVFIDYLLRRNAD